MRVRFRGQRQLIGNLIVTVGWLLLFIVELVAVIVAPPSNGTEEGGIVIGLIGLIAMGSLLMRMRWAFTIEIDGETMVYRTLLTTRRFARGDIAGIGVKERNRGLTKLMQPYLEMKDGRTVWLADMGQGKLIAPNSTMQEELVTAITQWIA
jgi:hypothetical protein